MNVKELIECLSNCDGDDEVHIAYSARDHWGTTLCPVLRCVEDGEVERSEYHRCDTLITSDRDRDTDDPPTRSVVVLK